LHGINAIGEVGWTDTHKVCVGLIDAGIFKIVLGTVDGAEFESHVYSPRIYAPPNLQSRFQMALS
jgi:hypothetical protein